MRNYWPTESHDMQSAYAIANEYFELNEGEPLSFFEVVVDTDNKNYELKVPKWVMDVLTYFRQLYGYEHGQAVASQVLTKFFLRDEVVH